MTRIVSPLDGGSAARRSELERICREFDVRRLVLFGSAARAEDDPATSDVDLLVDFAPPRDGNRFRQFMGLKRTLEELLGRPVDLVSARAVRSARFRSSIERDAIEVYAA